MAGFVDELTTRVSVEIDSSDIDDAISRVSGDSILSELGLAEELQEVKSELNELKEPLTDAVAQALSNNQETIINTKHRISGMMANSVDISSDGDDRLVGNTATSVDGFPYPLAIEKGSKQHWIAPVTFDYLHWTDSGNDFFSKGHMVSGIKADPFVQYSIDETMYQIDEIFNSM